MEWLSVKALLLEEGGASVQGAGIEGYIGRSTAGPSARGRGSVFFTNGKQRVRLAIQPESPLRLLHRGGGEAVLRKGDREIRGRLEEVALHCPRQAYITVSERCIFRCRYCQVPLQPGRVKTAEEVRSLVESVADRIDAISLTSGVADSVAGEERRVLDAVREVRRFDLPIGVSIYPTLETPVRLRDAGADEVKFNVEAATPPLFARMCPGLDWGEMWAVLERSVEVFGEGRVFSNVIVGLGESDAEMEGCIDALVERGVIPVLRPLTPAAELAGCRRPSAARLLSLCAYHEAALRKAGLDPRSARTLCTACTGCDLTPGRDT